LCERAPVEIVGDEARGEGAAHHLLLQPQLLCLPVVVVLLLPLAVQTVEDAARLAVFLVGGEGVLEEGPDGGSWGLNGVVG
jgi:hypothetical protein